jgi:ATP-dependent Lon protease
MNDLPNPTPSASADSTPVRPEDLARSLPVLPLMNMLFLPGAPTPVNIGRPKSQRLIEDIQCPNDLIGVFCQRDTQQEDPEFDDLYPVGLVARVINITKEENGTTSVLLMGENRVHLDEITATEPYLSGRFSLIETTLPPAADKEFEEQQKAIKDKTIRILTSKIALPDFLLESLQRTKDYDYMINLAFTTADASIESKHDILACNHLKERNNKLLSLLDHELQLLEIKESIRRKTQVDINNQQREYFLQQEMKNIQEALGGSIHDLELKEIKEKAEAIHFTPDQRLAFARELKKLESLHPHSPDYSTQMAYIQTVLSLPWNSHTKDNFNLARAKKILDKDHFGLDRVKDRILEHLAVLKLKADLKSPILCLVGPPGVGKTSLGRSIADALGRRYIRLSLGGLHDEAEIRGHRRTYIGAMPGRIIHSLRKAGSSNPVIILDEIDKIGHNHYKSDPAAALLEVLDPEQNMAFHDNYLDMDFDLSRVLFIATANTLTGVSPALVDRMEVIPVEGYVLEEKTEIARRHLLPAQKKNHGIAKNSFTLPRKTLAALIESYTRESGVRELNKKIARILRKIARAIAENAPYPHSLPPQSLSDYLGPVEYTRDSSATDPYTGVITGLAWTAAGGEILLIEASLSRGKDTRLTLTGNLGEVMKESAILSLEYVKANAPRLDIPDTALDQWNVHIHVPEGAIPKDGPSAGITLTAALVSAFGQKKVKPRLAMTGEMTLRGKVLPVGGIKEKILAARRAGIREVILPRANRRHVEEINPTYLRGLLIHYVDDIREVLSIAFPKP